MESEVNAKEDDVIAMFLHPHGPSASFSCSQRDDVYVVSITHHSVVKPPTQSLKGLINPLQNA